MWNTIVYDPTENTFSVDNQDDPGRARTVGSEPEVAVWKNDPVRKFLKLGYMVVNSGAKSFETETSCMVSAKLCWFSG